jgi:hypothetical protein
MTWQLLIWNIFVWSFTGLMIYVNQASMWWLIIPALFTGTQNATQLYNSLEKTNSEDEYEFDEATRKKMLDLIERSENKLKRGR